MEHDPYSPPQAPVSDGAEPERPARRPPQVDKAVRLLWTALALGVVNTALQLRLFDQAGTLATVLITQALVFLLVVWLTLRISAGRNWARIVYLVMSAIGVPVVLIGLPAMFDFVPVSAMITIVQLALQIWALVLLVTEPGRQWFRPEPVT